jgi:hypothetical protein
VDPLVLDSLRTRTTIPGERQASSCDAIHLHIP